MCLNLAASKASGGLVLSTNQLLNTSGPQKQQPVTLKLEKVG